MHANDQIRPGSDYPETLSEGTKILKGEYVLKAIRQCNMDQGIIFCRTKLDCDNLETYMKRKAPGNYFLRRRMGLAISLVSTHQEKVWYHQCPSRGVNCHNTALTTQRGCAIWYDETKLLDEIEEHLGSLYEGHAVQLSGAVAHLADLERSLQLSYLRMFMPAEKAK
ncbi:unnamed protein product [Gongylonema pulchrum]|uniref:FLYWCH-type domain-containing protein n=1 Tax=Gongylonema pulchrum TaxID=637853 RepID=A0A183E4B5_9BILA|nr:unnamed protein product [Gongylonema pulchrum]